MRLVATCLTLAPILAGAACGDDDGEVRVSQAAIDALQAYTFVSEVSVESDEGDLRLTYDAQTDGQSIAGSFNGENDLLATFDMPAEADIVSVDGQRWIRPAGEGWQPVTRSSSIDIARAQALDLRHFYATPSLFLHFYRFDDPLLPTEDSAKIQGIRAKKVVLDRDDVIDAVSKSVGVSLPDQGTYELTDQDRSSIQEDADEALPEDFTIEAWIAEDEGYPVRLVVDFTVTTGDEGLLVGTFPPGARVHLQMDITDPKADVQITPPLPLEATATPPPVGETPEVTP